MLAHLEGIALERGRHRASTEVAWRYDADPLGADVPDVAWAVAHGYRLGLVDVQRQVQLPVDDALLERLAHGAAAHHEGYELRSFVGPVPEELLQGWVELASSLMTEAPLGTLEREAEPPDLDGHREMEALIEAQGRLKFGTAALAPNGDVVAYTDIAVTVPEPEKAFQWGTLVRRDHRGHRLGLAVKLANLRLLQAHLAAHGPAAERLVTYNAEVNEHMIGVNEQLGFVPVERLGEFQKTL